jgi:hypothetical protein
MLWFAFPGGCNVGTGTADIYNAAGQFLTNVTSDCTGNALLWTLPGTGTYTILVHSQNYSSTSGYDLSIQSVVGACGATAISCGQTINTNGTVHDTDMNAYEFAGNQGQMLWFAFQWGCNVGTGTADIYNAAGQFLTNVTSDCTGNALLWTLPGTGTYTILVHSQNYSSTSSYGLSIQSVVGGGCNGTEIRCGQTVSSGTTNNTEMDAYGFPADAGEEAILSTSGFGGVAFAVYDPNGSNVTSVGPSVETNLTFSLTGYYTILVHAGSYHSSGSYNFTLTCLNQTSVSVSATTPNASDLGPVPGVFTVTRSGPTNGALPVHYSLSGTASDGLDYSSLASPMVIPAGALSATVTVTPILYSTANSSCATILTLATNPFYEVGSPATASVTITQIPPPILTVPPNQIVMLGSALQVTNTVTNQYIPSSQFLFTNVSSPGGVVLNPATGLLTWTPASLGTNRITIEVYDTNAPGFMAITNFTVVVTPVGQPPANVNISPPSQTVFEGATASLTASAAGTVPFTYQWYFTNTPIAGATNSTLVFADVQPAAAGTSYFVTVSNAYGAATNLNGAALNVLTFTASHDSTTYGSPGICVVSCQLSYALDRPLLILLLQPVLPPGWALQSVTGPGSPEINSGAIVFEGSPLPNPLNFAYTAAVPGGQTNQQTLTNNLVYFLPGMTDASNFLATPNPLQVNYGPFLTVGQQNGQLGLTLFGDTGLNYNLQASTNMVNWTNFGALTPVGGLIQTNVPMTGNQLLFRTESSH